MKKLKYKGVKGTVEYDSESDIYIGQVKGHPEILFDGDDMHDAKIQFEYIVDNILKSENN